MRKSSKISGIIVIILIAFALFFSVLADICVEEYELDILNKNFDLGKGYSQSYEFNLFGESEIKIKMKSTEPINFYIMSEENHLRRIGPNWKSFISEYEILNTKEIDKIIKLDLRGKYYLTFSNWGGSRDTYIESKITTIHYQNNSTFETFYFILLLPVVPIGIFFIGSLVPESWDEKIISFFSTNKKIKKQNKLNRIRIIINSEKKDSSLELLKNYEKLSDKEIIAFLFLKNNPATDKAKLIEMFGENAIDSLIQKKLFFEEEN